MCRNREKVVEQWKEREWERDIRRPRRDKPQQCDELFVKWLLFSSRASQPFFFSSSFFSMKGYKTKTEQHLETIHRKGDGVPYVSQVNYPRKVSFLVILSFGAAVDTLSPLLKRPQTHGAEFSSR